MKILLLEDEYALRKTIAEMLKDNGYKIEEFSNGQEALKRAMDRKYDLLLLDVNVPEINGFEILSTIRQKGNQTPAIFITSLTEVDSLEKGFDTGCCDYIKKPFDMKELLIRVSSAIKQTTALKEQDPIIELCCGYAYDTKRFVLTYGEDEIALSKTEKMILDLFIKHPNSVVTQEMIIEYIWDGYADPANVRVQINNLRKKLDKRLIVNIRGLGYKLEI